VSEVGGKGGGGGKRGEMTQAFYADLNKKINSARNSSFVL
jgi:hypothetical protein